MTQKKYENAWDLRARDKHCVDCKWGDFNTMGPPGVFGACRKRSSANGWPEIRQADWCSEFEKSKQAKVEEDEIAAENP